jgi:hypothetical protein
VIVRLCDYADSLLLPVGSPWQRLVQKHGYGIKGRRGRIWGKWVMDNQFWNIETSHIVMLLRCSNAPASLRQPTSGLPPQMLYKSFSTPVIDSVPVDAPTSRLVQLVSLTCTLAAQLSSFVDGLPVRTIEENFPPTARPPAYSRVMPPMTTQQLTLTRPPCVYQYNVLSPLVPCRLQFDGEVTSSPLSPLTSTLHPQPPS